MVMMMSGLKCISSYFTLTVLVKTFFFYEIGDDNFFRVNIKFTILCTSAAILLHSKIYTYKMLTGSKTPLLV